MNFVLTIWFFVGGVYAVQVAQGSTISDIENNWQRKVAWVLCLPFFLGLWLLIKFIDYIQFVLEDLPPTLQALKDSWNGVPSKDKD